jgi:aldose 1-epimerase
MTTPNSPDTEYHLKSGKAVVRVAPFGASLRGMWLGDTEVVSSYSGAASKLGGQGDLLIPFPGRVAGAAYEFEGKQYHLEANDKDGPNAIHGFMRTLLWNVDALETDHALFSAELQGAHGYPFQIRAQMEYRLTSTEASAELTCRCTVTNTGATSAPAAVGFHPYFSADGLIDACQLELPVQSYLDFVNLIPTGKVLDTEGTDLDFRTMKQIGSTRFNTCYLNPLRDEDGKTRFRLVRPDGVSTTVWMDDTLNYVVVYSGDPLPESHRRRSLAIEPMSCGSDAFNHAEWGLWHLAPGESKTVIWGVQAAG